MKDKTLILAAAMLLAGLPAAQAADGEAAWLADFRKADLNDSGGLSQVELDKTKSAQLAPLKKNFKAIDQDGDGQVTQAEYERHLSQTDAKLAARFKQADLNDSGGLSKKELDKANAAELAPLKKNFAAIDADQDGQVTPAEYRQFLGAGGKTETQAAANDQCPGDCGRVTKVKHFKQKGEGGVLGAVAGGVAGGLLGSQVGKGTGNTVATVGGAAGGAYAGYQVEKQLKSKKMVKVTVKFDDGHEQSFEFEEDKNDFATGDRVQVQDGKLTRYGGQ